MKNLLILLSILSFALSTSQSQDLIDNKGKEFHFAYMPNFHNGKNGFGNSDDNDSIYVFISADVPTSGELTRTDRFGFVDTEEFTINDPSEIKVFAYRYLNYELIGINDSGILPTDGGNSGNIVNQSFKIETDQEVAVVIHNEAQFTSDGCLLYPNDALGKNYFVFSYNSNVVGNAGSNTPSQFIIVGTKDNTSVTIEPSGDIFSYGDDSFQITLNEGDVFLAQADIFNGAPESIDLTGTRIISDKKVAVLGGHQRANIPFDELNSRDLLMSQMIPLESWGRDVFIVPFADPEQVFNSEPDISKITVAYDDTEIYIAGDYYETLDRGESITLPIVDPIYVEGNKPIRACIYKKSTNSNSGQAGNSDPFMVLYPPKDQFLEQYKFINLQTYFTLNNGTELPAYDNHFVSVIVPNSAINSIEIDGVLQQSNIFNPIEGADFQYANINVNSGQHTIRANEPIGICVYGYGRTNSYGYVGGLGLRELDWSPPELTTNYGCYSAESSMTEEYEHDSGITEFEITREDNVIYNIIEQTERRVAIKADIEDKFQDGFLNYKTVDSAGSVQKEEIFISGFTFSFNNTDRFEYQQFIDSAITGERKCVNLQLHNYSSKGKDIEGLFSKDGIYEVNYTNKFIPAGGVIDVEVCYETRVNSENVRDEILLSYGCDTVPLALLIFWQGEDEFSPTFTGTVGDCNDEIKYQVFENLGFDYGIEGISATEFDNVLLSVESKNYKEMVFNLSLDDPYQDGFYKITVSDIAGNDTTITGAIQGFTLGFEVPDDETINMIDNNIGGVNCTPITLKNYGNFPLKLNDVRLRDKIYFSIPSSQIPITILPDSTEELFVCFSEEAFEEDLDYSDEISFGFNCLEQDIPVNSDTYIISIEGDSRCEYDFEILITDVPNMTFLESIYPNPTPGEFKVKFGIPENDIVSFTVYDNLGNKIDLLKTQLKPGVFELEIQTDELSAGHYFFEMKTSLNRVTKRLIIAK